MIHIVSLAVRSCWTICTIPVGVSSRLASGALLRCHHDGCCLHRNLQRSALRICAGQMTRSSPPACTESDMQGSCRAASCNPHPSRAAVPLPTSSRPFTLVFGTEEEEALTVNAPLVSMQHRSRGEGAMPAQRQLGARGGVESTELRARSAGLVGSDARAECRTDWHCSAGPYA